MNIDTKTSIAANTINLIYEKLTKGNGFLGVVGFVILVYYFLGADLLPENSKGIQIFELDGQPAYLSSEIALLLGVSSLLYSVGLKFYKYWKGRSIGSKINREWLELYGASLERNVDLPYLLGVAIPAKDLKNIYQFVENNGKYRIDILLKKRIEANFAIVSTEDWFELSAPLKSKFRSYTIHFLSTFSPILFLTFLMVFLLLIQIRETISYAEATVFVLCVFSGLVIYPLNSMANAITTAEWFEYIFEKEKSG